MMGVMWWTRMVNAVRFLDDAQEALEEGRSVLLHFSGEVPWAEIMADELCQRLAGFTDSRTFDVHDVSHVTEPGAYLFSHYCSEEERRKYWPSKHISHMRFMAGNPNIPLNRRYVCLTGIPSGKAEQWVRAVSEYLEHCRENEEHGVFIMVTQNANVRGSEQIACLQYSDYVTDYDCMMLCLTMLSSLPCSRMQKLYLAETASGIAQNNVEIAGLLISEGMELARAPLTVSRRVFEENGIPTARLDETVSAAVWEAQIRLVFPKMEDFRRALVQKYERKLEHFLPMKSAAGERIDKPFDLEVGQLCYICKGNKLLEHSEYEMLGKMRAARNKLAHRDALSYDELMQLSIF